MNNLFGKLLTPLTLTMYAGKAAYAQALEPYDPLSPSAVARTVISLVLVLSLAVLTIVFLKKRSHTFPLRKERSTPTFVVNERIPLDRHNQLITVRYNEHEQLVLTVSAAKGVKLLGVLNANGAFVTNISDRTAELPFDSELFDNLDLPFELNDPDPEDDQDKH